MEMGQLSWPMTHVTHHTVDPWPTWPMTHDPWSLPLRMGQGGGVAWWYWTTLSVLRAKKSYVKIKSPAMIIGLIEWVSSLLMSAKNKKLQATAQLFRHHGSMGHWHWPMTHWPISISVTYTLYPHATNMARCSNIGLGIFRLPWVCVAIIVCQLMHAVARWIELLRIVHGALTMICYYYLLYFIMKIVHEVQETKQKKEKSAKRCKVLVCAQAKNELFNVTESKVI